MKSVQEINSLIFGANGTDAYHKFSPFPWYPVITDGVLAVADAAACFWFLDIIGSYQTNKKLDPNFQVWKLTVDTEKKTAVAEGCNDTKVVVKQRIGYTDFPLEELKLFLIDGIILLPS